METFSTALSLVLCFVKGIALVSPQSFVSSSLVFWFVARASPSPPSGAVHPLLFFVCACVFVLSPKAIVFSGFCFAVWLFRCVSVCRWQGPVRVVRRINYFTQTIVLLFIVSTSALFVWKV